MSSIPPLSSSPNNDNNNYNYNNTTVILNQSKQQQQQQQNSHHHIDLGECVWAINYPEVQKACYLSKVCTISPPKCCKFKNITAILQDGPTCGLTALSMLFGGQPTPNEILEMAKNRNYTYNGEMFSAKNLFQLVCHISKKIDTKIECQLYEGHLNCAKIKNDLKNGACIFVPYPFQKKN